MDPTSSPKNEERPVTNTPEVDLGLTDSEIVEFIDRKISEYDLLYKKLDVEKRSEKNRRYYSGHQEEDKTSKVEGQKSYVQNRIYKDLNTKAQNATSTMPDITVFTPQQEDDLNLKDQAKQVENWLKIRLDSDVTRRLAYNAIKDNHRDLRGVWFYRYDFDKKDVVIERVKPKDVVLDATATIPEDGYTADNMEFVGIWVEEPTAKVLSKFSDKADEIKAELNKEATSKGEKVLPSKIRYLQSFSTMHDADGNPKEIYTCKYQNILLYKGKSPYWDDTEEVEESFGIIPPDKIGEGPVEQINDILQAGVAVEPPKPKAKRKNFFPFARKPITLFVGDPAQEGPLDETTLVEQAIPLQDIVNKRGDQITLINDWAVPKTVTTAKAMTEEKASNVSRDPSEVIVLDGEIEDVRYGLMTFSGEMASPALYKDLQDNIAAIDDLFSTNPIRQATGESGLSKQISRENDLASADFLQQFMVNRAVEEAAGWLVQLAKIYFDQPKSVSSPGRDSTLMKAEVSSSLIPDDLQIVVKASAVDKSVRRDMSLNLASMKAIDPMSLFEDMDYPNPKEMTKRWVDFMNGPASGYVEYQQDVGINVLQPGNLQTEGMGADVAAPPITAPPPQVSIG